MPENHFRLGLDSNLAEVILRTHLCNPYIRQQSNLSTGHHYTGELEITEKNTMVQSAVNVTNFVIGLQVACAVAIIKSLVREHKIA